MIFPSFYLSSNFGLLLQKIEYNNWKSCKFMLVEFTVYTLSNFIVFPLKGYLKFTFWCYRKKIYKMIIWYVLKSAPHETLVSDLLYGRIIGYYFHFFLHTYLKVARATAKDLFVKPAQCFEREIIKKSLNLPYYKTSLNPVMKMNFASNRTDRIWENLGINA